MSTVGTDSVSTEPFTIELVTEDGETHLVMSGRDGWQEPVCPVCHEPIRWVLDMFSFTTQGNDGAFRLGHARCLWTRGAFEDEARKAPRTGDGDEHRGD